ncbi:hypothetical protein PFISCL1PPCAC_25742, partial [Pristionchus fissidentatus]
MSASFNTLISFGEETIDLSVDLKPTTEKTIDRRQFPYVRAAIAISFIIVIAFSVTIFYYVNTAPINLTSPHLPSIPSHIAAVQQVVGRLPQKSNTNVLILNVQIMIYNTANDHFGGGEYRPMGGLYSNSATQTHAEGDLFVSHILVHTVAVIEEGQSGFMQCRASHATMKFPTHLFLRFEISVMLQMGRTNIF